MNQQNTLFAIPWRILSESPFPRWTLLTTPILHPEIVVSLKLSNKGTYVSETQKKDNFVLDTTANNYIVTDSLEKVHLVLCTHISCQDYMLKLSGYLSLNPLRWTIQTSFWTFQESRVLGKGWKHHPESIRARYHTYFQSRLLQISTLLFMNWVY